MLKWPCKCRACHSGFEMGPDNAQVVHYSRCRGYDHIDTRCPNCGQLIRIWGIDAEDVAVAREEEFLIETDFPSEQAIDAYNDYFGIKVEQRWLSARVERQIAFEVAALDREWEQLDA